MGCKEAPNLPHDVLHSIVGRLSSLVCCAAFRSVCKPWRSFFMKHYSHLVPPPPPWLMLPDLNYLSDSSYTKVYGLYGSDEQKQFYQCKIPDNCEIFVGSSGTWLAYIDNKRRKLRVWNPLSLTEISLPFVSNKAIKLGKVVVSCPGPLIKNAIEDVVFGAVYDSTQFACIALGDKDWTNIEVDFFPSKPTIRIDDLVFYKGKFFLVDHSGMVFVCERNVPVPRDHDLHYRHPLKAIKLIDHVHMSSLEQNLIQEIPSCAGINNYYLIEIEGELMLVVQFTYTSYFRSIDGFKIFKFDFSRSRKLQALMRKVNVRGWSLFLSSRDHSMASKTVSGRSLIYFKTHTYFEKSQSEVRSHKILVSHYLCESPCAVLSQVTKLHCHCTHPVWIIPKYTNDNDHLKPRSSSSKKKTFETNVLLQFFVILLLILIISGFIYLVRPV